MATNKKKTKHRKKGKNHSKNKSSKQENNTNEHAKAPSAKTTNGYKNLLTNTSMRFHLLLFLIKIIIYEVISLPFFFILGYLYQPPSPPTSWSSKMGMIIYFGELIEYKQKYSNLSPFAVQQWAYQKLRELSLKESISIPSSLKEGIIDKPCSIYPPNLLSTIKQYDYLCNGYSYLHDNNIIKPIVYTSYMLVLTVGFSNLSPLALDLWHNIILALLVIIISIIYYKNEPKYYAAGKKNPLKTALVVSMQELIANQRELYENTNNKSPEESQAWIISLKSNSNTSPFGFARSKKKGTVYGQQNKNKTFWNEVVSHPAVKEQLEDGDTAPIKDSLWRNSFQVAWPFKCKEYKGSKRKVGEVSSSAASNSMSGKAAENVQKESGLINLLGGKANFDECMRACEACREGDTSTVVEGMYGSFTPATAELIALEKVGENIDLLVQNTTGLNCREDVFGRLSNEPNSIWDFVLGYGENLAGLEEECRDIAKWESEQRGLESDDQPVSDLENGRGTLLFLTCLNILVAFENITDGLLEQKLVCCMDKYGSYRLLAHAGAKMKKQYCVGGGTVKQGLDPSDYDRFMVSNGYTFVEMFQAEHDPDQVLVLNMNAKASDTGKNGNTKELGALLTIPGTDRYARNCAVYPAQGQTLTTYMVWLVKTPVTIHQLVYTVGAHNGFGMIKSGTDRAYERDIII